MVAAMPLVIVAVATPLEIMSATTPWDFLLAATPGDSVVAKRPWDSVLAGNARGFRGDGNVKAGGNEAAAHYGDDFRGVDVEAGSLR